MLKGVKISGTGSFLPDRILTNHDLEKMIDTSDEWIKTRTGICERRIADENTATSDLAIEAAKKALKNAHKKPEEVDLIIVATVTPDMIFPSTACFVQRGIGAKHAAAFDISAACSGFIYGLAVGYQFIASGMYDTVLVIGAEVYSRIVDWTDRNTCVLFGDGAGAVVLEPTNKDEGILAIDLETDGNTAELLMVPGGGSRNPICQKTLDHRLNFVKMKGNEVFKFAVNSLVKTTRKVLAKAKLKPEDVDHIVPHQANVRIIDALTKKLKIDPEKAFINIEKYGNTSAASIGIALDELVHSKKLKKGQIIVTNAFGGGLTWGACVIKW
ncbi:ketoacyl-ACP synthase III [Candidatus Desantisbacteria bacterium]|nr:ketoacyl-ACP synthase III [Candidatus Desantisbacteria bacterium]